MIVGDLEQTVRFLVVKVEAGRRMEFETRHSPLTERPFDELDRTVASRIDGGEGDEFVVFGTDLRDVTVDVFDRCLRFTHVESPVDGEDHLSIDPGLVHPFQQPFGFRIPVRRQVSFANRRAGDLVALFLVFPDDDIDEALPPALGKPVLGPEM